MINWQAIDTVLLDMDGTLLDLHYDNYFWQTHLPRRYADIHSVSLDESTHKISEEIEALEGTLNWYCLDYWSESLQVNIPELKQEVRHKIQQRPYAEGFLSALKKCNKSLYLVTNSHPTGTEMKLSATQIKPYFDDIISSHQFKHPKEDQAFWHALQNHTPFDPECTLFIDDNLTVLGAAAQYGIKHVLGIHQPNSQVARVLSNVPAIYHFDEIMGGLET